MGKALRVLSNVLILGVLGLLLQPEPQEGTYLAYVSWLIPILSSVLGGAAAGGVGGATSEAPKQPSHNDMLLYPEGRFGSGAEGELKRLARDLFESDFDFFKSKPYKKRSRLYEHVDPRTLALIDQAVTFGGSPVPGEEALGAFAQSLLGGQAEGRESVSPFSRFLTDEITRRGRQTRLDATEEFESDAARLLGGVSGAGSAIKPLRDLKAEFGQREQESIYRTVAALEEAERDRALQLLLNPDQALLFPLRRLTGTAEISDFERKVKDLGIQRALGLFATQEGLKLSALQTGTGAGTPTVPGFQSSPGSSVNLQDAGALLGSGVSNAYRAYQTRNSGTNPTVLGFTGGGTPFADSYASTGGFNVSGPTNDQLLGGYFSNAYGRGSLFSGRSGGGTSSPLGGAFYGDGLDLSSFFSGAAGSVSP